LGTVEKDEAAILKVLQRKVKGIRSTDLWLAVRGSVRSLTTFQKRLKHLEEMGRVQIKPDISDPRARVITPTEISVEASHVLEAIDLLERLYLRKPSRKVVRVTEERQGLRTEKEMQETAAMNLLQIAHETYLKSWTGQPFDDSRVYIWVHEEKEGPQTGLLINFICRSTFEMLQTEIDRSTGEIGRLGKLTEALADRMRVVSALLDSVWRKVDAGLIPEDIADEWRQILASFGAGEGKTIPS
jgi:hypothetical protein